MKTVIEMAREAGFVDYELEDYSPSGYDIRYERFADLIRADELRLVRRCVRNFLIWKTTRVMKQSNAQKQSEREVTNELPQL